ncbi:hypothetical protein Tco_0696508 [Tanacetum coccineum]
MFQEIAEVDDDQEAAKIKELMKIIPDEKEVAIDAIPLATKPPTIVDCERKTITRSSELMEVQRCTSVFQSMLQKQFTGKFKTRGNLVKAKYGSTRPVEDLDLILWGDLKTMFEPHVKDRVWRNQQDYRVLDWKLYDSSGVHSLRMQHMHIHMLYKVNATEGVNAASEEVSTAEWLRLAYGCGDGDVPSVWRDGDRGGGEYVLVDRVALMVWHHDVSMYVDEVTGVRDDGEMTRKKVEREAVC